MTISNISTSELQNVDRQGKNDPFVLFRVGKKRRVTTGVREDAGAAAQWLDNKGEPEEVSRPRPPPCCPSTS